MMTFGAGDGVGASATGGTTADGAGMAGARVGVGAGGAGATVLAKGKSCKFYQYRRIMTFLVLCCRLVSLMNRTRLDESVANFDQLCRARISTTRLATLPIRARDHPSSPTRSPAPSIPLDTPREKLFLVVFCTETFPIPHEGARKLTRR